jgi:hypothetical protein
MSEVSYNFTISTTFTNGLNIFQLKGEITDSSISSQSFIRIDRDDDTLMIVFSGTLSGRDQTTLNLVVANHVAEVVRSTFLSILINSSTTSDNNVYQVIGGQFKFEGSNQIGTINSVEVIVNIDTSVTSGSIRLYDVTNSLVIAEVTGITNTISDIINLGTVTNVPEEAAIFELHAKKSGGGSKKVINVKNLIVYYGN